MSIATVETAAEGVLAPHIAAIKIGIAVLGIVAIAAGSAWATHQIDEAAYLKLEAKYKDAEVAAVSLAKAVQKAEDDVSLQAAVKEAASQQKIVTQTQIVTKEVPIHVPISSKCAVTVGFVRVLNAAILGGSAADVSYAAGQPDDACAPTDARSLASNIIVNYGTCLANAQQLTSLQAWAAAIGKVTKDAAAKKP